MASAAPPPISKFAPPRTFEHTPPPASASELNMHHARYLQHTQYQHQGHHEHQQYQQHQQHQQHPHSSQPTSAPSYPPFAHNTLPPAGPTVASPNMSPTTPAEEKGGAMSRLKRSFGLRSRQPLSRTWEKASFAEECQSAPASMVDLNHEGVQGGRGAGEHIGPEAGLQARERQGAIEGAIRRSADGSNVHAALFK